MQTRQAVLSLLAVVALFEGVASATSQAYPSRPITIVIPYAAGGQSDILIRILAERMRAPLGQPVIIDNVGGAAGRIGTGRIARSAPDGYTVGYGSAATHMANGAVYSLSYDVLKD